MKGDFTRDTFRPARHFSSVRMQQGRVQLDADWNEAEDIRLRRERVTGTDVIGGCGTPEADPGFGITFAAGGFKIGGGRYYADGILCENEADVEFDAQADYPGQADPTTGVQLFYLDVWEEHLTALEDTYIREVALNGPDTATRQRVVWQVKTHALPAGVTTCEAAMAQLLPATSARLQTRAKTLDDTEACTVKPGSSYKRLENQLYRFEVHTSGTLATATFKWSRDNGTVVTGFQAADGRTLIANSVGRDQMLSFASGQWIEVTDRRHELLSLPGEFFLVTRVDGNKLILDPLGPALNAANYGPDIKVRRWDSQKNITFTGLDANGYLTLEDGVQVLLTGADFRIGDYWLIPARTVTGDVEWPKTGLIPDALPPHGIDHARCPLAIATKTGATWSIVDCRNPFVPLTQVISMYYVAGDGQTVTPDPFIPSAFLPLDQNPTVGVSRGNQPVEGARVQFSIEQGAGQIVGLSTVPTNGQGLASCQWQLSSTDPVQKLRAVLLDSENAATHLPIVFTATLNTADKVAYTPNCPDLEAVGANTVQKAIDELCKRHGSNSCCKSVGVGGDFATLEEAFKILLADKQIRGICLCLMPGQHEWPNEPIEWPEGKSALSVTLTGIRGASAISSDRFIEIYNLEHLVISDLILNIHEGFVVRQVEEFDLTFSRVRGGGRWLVERTRALRIFDTIIGFDGMLDFKDNGHIWWRGVAAQIQSEFDAISIADYERLHIETCLLRNLTQSWDGATIRLQQGRQTLITGNEIRARRFAEQPPVVTHTLANAEGMVGEFVGELGKTMNKTAVNRRAKALLGASTTDRSARVGELDVLLSRNALVLGTEGVKRLQNLRDVLSRAEADEAMVAVAVAELNNAVSNPNTDTGMLAINEWPGVALVLEDGRGMFTITENIIYGYMSLYGNPGLQRIDAGMARMYDGVVQDGMPRWGIGALHFSNNDVLSVLLAETFASISGAGFKLFQANQSVEYPVFRALTFSDNTLAFPPFELLASGMTFTGNTINDLNRDQSQAGIFIGHRATYTGNLSHSQGDNVIEIVSATEYHGEAANVFLNIV